MNKIIISFLFIIISFPCYSNEIQGLGWLVRRSVDPISTGEFYKKILGLPELRRRDNLESKNIMLWAGGYSVLATNWKGKIYPKLNSLVDAEIIPIFRTSNITLVKSIVKQNNIVPIFDNTKKGSAIYFLDPSGFVVGVRQSVKKANLSSSITGDLFANTNNKIIPNIKNLNGYIQDLGWLRMNVHSPQLLGEFYTQDVGLDILENNEQDTISLYLGAGIMLELRAGGKPRTRPKDRKEVPDVWVLRGYNIDAFHDKMKRYNVPIINELTLEGGKINYYSDPEGHIFGYQERKEFDPKNQFTQRIEDLEARKAWELKK